MRHQLVEEPPLRVDLLAAPAAVCLQQPVLDLRRTVVRRVEELLDREAPSRRREIEGCVVAGHATAPVALDGAPGPLRRRGVPVRDGHPAVDHRRTSDREEPSRGGVGDRETNAP